MEYHASKGFGCYAGSVVHTVTAMKSRLRVPRHTSMAVVDVRRVLLVLLAVSVVACRRSSPTALLPTQDISGNWSGTLTTAQPE
jgi:hypothetical protein